MLVYHLSSLVTNYRNVNNIFLIRPFGIFPCLYLEYSLTIFEIYISIEEKFSKKKVQMLTKIGHWKVRQIFSDAKGSLKDFVTVH